MIERIVIVSWCLAIPAIGLSQDTKQLRPKHILRHTGYVNAAVLSADGKTVASAVADKEGESKVFVWDVSSGAQRLVLNSPHPMVMSLAISDDGKTLASASRDGSLSFWNLERGSLVSVTKEKLEFAIPVAFAGNGKLLVSQNVAGSPILWNAQKLGVVARLPKQPFDLTNSYTGLVVTKDGNRVAIAGGMLSLPNDILVFDLVTGKKLLTIEGPRNLANALAFSPDGSLIAAGFRYTSRGDRMIQVWNADKGQRVASFNHKYSVCSLAFSPDASIIAAGSNAGKISFWNMKNGEEKVLDAHDAQAFAVFFSPDGTRFISASFDSTVKVWELKPDKN